VNQPSKPSKPSKPKQPREGSRAWEEALAKNQNYARNIVIEILRNSPQGGEEPAASLNGWLKKFPELQSVVAQHFDLCARTEVVWIARLAGGNLIAKEAIKREIETLKLEVAGEAPTGLERILASTVAVTYMAQQLGAMTAAENTTLAEMAAVDRRAESMQKRFLRAIEFLNNFREKTKATQATLVSSRRKSAAAAKPRSRPAPTRRPRLEN